MYLYNLNIDLFIYLKNNDYLIKKKKILKFDSLKFFK